MSPAARLKVAVDGPSSRDFEDDLAAAVFDRPFQRLVPPTPPN
jgi:hypothetical protein